LRAGKLDELEWRWCCMSCSRVVLRSDRLVGLMF
jgi:hypothetical protein